MCLAQAQVPRHVMLMPLHLNQEQLLTVWQ
jgi:hypothetical protein